MAIVVELDEKHKHPNAQIVQCTVEKENKIIHGRCRNCHVLLPFSLRYIYCSIGWQRMKITIIRRFIVQLTYNGYVYLVVFMHFGMNTFDVHQKL